MIDFYCIHKLDDEPSQAPLNDAIASGKQFGINVIPHPGVYTDVHAKMTKEGLIINPAGSHKILRRGNDGKGVLGCFLSHYFLWKKCVELDVPIGVLEYDAIIIKPLPENILAQFNDYLNLDYTRNVYYTKEKGSKGHAYVAQIELEKNNPIKISQLQENCKSKSHEFKYINNNHIRGAFGYIIKPTGATKLINATKKHGILPADIQPNLLYCNMHHANPSIVMLNPKGISSRYGGSHTASGSSSS